MSIEMPRQGATSTDEPRPATTTPDSEFTLSIDEALQRYTDADLPRTPRSIQRYCALGHLEARRIDTQFGEKWLITAASVDRHIAYIREVTPPTGRDLSRPVATSDDTKNEPAPIEVESSDEPRQAATTTDMSRHVATSDDSKRYVQRLETDIDFLREQIATKDVQIKDLTERARETNHLIAGLQRMLTPLLGSKDRRDPSVEDRGFPSDADR